MSRISPKGTSPSLMRAWKPLQMPRTRPSRFCSRSITASATWGDAEKGGDELAGAVRLVAAGEAAGQEEDLTAPGPPGQTGRRMSATSVGGVWLFSTRICGSRPARSAARALSYSQLVPGNTGISTFGFAVPVLGSGAGEGRGLQYRHRRRIGRDCGWGIHPPARTRSGRAARRWGRCQRRW